MVQDPPPRQELITGHKIVWEHPWAEATYLVLLVTCNQNLPMAWHIHSATQTYLIKREESSPI